MSIIQVHKKYFFYGVQFLFDVKNEFKINCNKYTYKN